MTAYIARSDHRPNRKDNRRDNTRKISPAPAVPELPTPFVQVLHCHWCIIHDEVTCTLFYDRACELWQVRFDWPGLTVGKHNQFQRDTPARQMQAEIIEAIDGR